jgi:P4 family phage/plasmid primase-like protien
MELEDYFRGNYHLATDSGKTLHWFDQRVYRADPRLTWLHGRVQDYVKKIKPRWRGVYMSAPRKVLADLGHELTGGLDRLWEKGPKENLLNLQNGVLDLNTNTLHDHWPGWMSTVGLPVAYPEDVDDLKVCDPGVWQRFIEGLFPDDSPTLAWEVLGRVLSPCGNLQEALFLSGSGSNGKSTFLNAIPLLVGEENISRVKVKSIDGDKFAITDLHGKLVNIDTDTEASNWKETSVFKQIVEGQEVRGQRKYQPAFVFKPFCAVLLAGNSLPRADDTSHGFFRRMPLVPFVRQFTAGNPWTRQHSEILRELRRPAALAGALVKAIDGLRRVRERGKYYKSQSMLEMMDEYMEMEDPTWGVVNGFVRMVMGTREAVEGMNGWWFVTKSELKHAQHEWAVEHRGVPLTSHALTAWINQHKRGTAEGWGVTQRTVDGERVRGWLVKGEAVAKGGDSHAVRVDTDDWAGEWVN